mgnify:CR=1 FL=1
MRVIRSLDGVTPAGSGTVVTIGNFDGVHLGHQAILQQVVARAVVVEVLVDIMLQEWWGWWG